MEWRPPSLLASPFYTTSPKSPRVPIEYGESVLFPFGSQYLGFLRPWEEGRSKVTLVLRRKRKKNRENDLLYLFQIFERERVFLVEIQYYFSLKRIKEIKIERVKLLLLWLVWLGLAWREGKKDRERNSLSLFVFDFLKVEKERKKNVLISFLFGFPILKLKMPNVLRKTGLE